MADTFREYLFDVIYRNQAPIRLLIGVCVLFLLLMLVSLRVTERGTATYVITLVNVISLSAIATVCLALLLLCRRRMIEEQSDEP